MLSVKQRAKESLRGILSKSKEEDATLIRIAHSASNPARVGFVFDKEKEGDKVIRDNKGGKLLVIDKDVSEELNDMVLDIKETNTGLKYTITKC